MEHTGATYTDNCLSAPWALKTTTLRERFAVALSLKDVQQLVLAPCHGLGKEIQDLTLSCHLLLRYKRLWALGLNQTELIHLSGH